MVFNAEREVPALASLVVSSPTVAAEMRVDSLHEYLIGNPELHCLPVLREEQVTGVIFSKEFLKSMSQQYVRELSRRKSVADFMQKDYFAASPTDRITDVLAKLLQHDPLLDTDSIVVRDGARYCGVVPVPQLMLALSDTQQRLLTRLDRLSQRLSEEVNITAQLQRELMPRQALKHRDIRVCAKLETSSEVGGDFYDYFVLRDRFIVVAIGDASGHGVPAGMLVAAAKATLHSLPIEVMLEPDQVLRQLNRAILATASSVRLMTFFYLVIDCDQLTARFANAGHNFPYYWRAVDANWLSLDDASGLPLGLDADVSYPVRDVVLAGADRLVFYSDGLIEECDDNEELIGYDRLEGWLGQLIHQPAENLIERLMGQVKGFGEAGTLQDDVTLVVVDVSARKMAENCEYIYTLLRSSAESHRCPAEAVLKQRGMSVVDGAEPVFDAQLFPVPLMTQAFFDGQLHYMPEFEPGESPILLFERPPRMQIGNLKATGVTRALDLNDPLLFDLGLTHLVRGRSPEHFLSLSYLFQNVVQHRLDRTHLKETLIDQVAASLTDAGFADSRPDCLSAVALLMDEMLENAFMALPAAEREARGLVKGGAREFLPGEQVEVAWGSNERLFGLSITDSWGTLDPRSLLEAFERHRYGGGIVAGEGGAGLWLLWRFADYFHIHVAPNERTTVFIFFGREGAIDPERDKSFQLTVQLAN